MHNLNEQLEKLSKLIRNHGACKSAKVVATVDTENNVMFSVSADLLAEWKEQDPEKVTSVILKQFSSFIENPSPLWRIELDAGFYKNGSLEHAHVNKFVCKPQAFDYTITCHVDTGGRAKKWKLPLPAPGLLVRSFTVNDEQVNACKLFPGQPELWFGATNKHGCVEYNENTGEISLKRVGANKGIYLLAHFSG